MLLRLGFTRRWLERFGETVEGVSCASFIQEQLQRSGASPETCPCRSGHRSCLSQSLRARTTPPPATRGPCTRGLTPRERTSPVAGAPSPVGTCPSLGETPPNRRTLCLRAPRRP